VRAVENSSFLNIFSVPFGAEYARRPTWGILERSYIRMFGLLDLPGRLRARIVMPELHRLPLRRVVDLGSGTGCYSFYLSRNHCTEITGVEIERGRVSESSHIAERLGRGNVRFFCGSADQCLKSFPSEAFEMALAIEVLQYFTDAASILRETYRVLTPGGYLLGHVPVLGRLRPGEMTLFDDHQIQEILREAQFQIIKIRPTFGGIPRKLCSLYDRLSRRRMLVGVLFPFILLASAVFALENPNGDYRFFLARKPAGKMTENGRLKDER
jgi:ubiquinone/menaquinone biosynthesis C-methylase UbiE